MAKPPFGETKLWMWIPSPLLAASKTNNGDISFSNRTSQAANDLSSVTRRPLQSSHALHKWEVHIEWSQNWVKLVLIRRHIIVEKVFKVFISQTIKSSAQGKLKVVLRGQWDQNWEWSRQTERDVSTFTDLEIPCKYNCELTTVVLNHPRRSRPLSHFLQQLGAQWKNIIRRQLVAVSISWKRHMIFKYIS